VVVDLPTLELVAVSDAALATRAASARAAGAPASRWRHDVTAAVPTLAGVPRPLTAVLLALLALVFAVSAAACGEDEEPAQPAQTQAQEPAETQEAPATTEPATGRADVEVGGAKDLERKPRIRRPPGEPPAALQTRDLVTGKGAGAQAGDTISVQYVGVSFSNGKEFDASWERGEPFAFPLGAGQVIPGWDQGLVGMKAGGRRVLVIPPDQAYGPQGSPPAIGPNETLVFVVDLEQIG